MAIFVTEAAHLAAFPPTLAAGIVIQPRLFHDRVMALVLREDELPFDTHRQGSSVESTAKQRPA